MKKANSIDDYISEFPVDVQVLLQDLRNIINKSAPEAQEVISYQMPAYKQNGILVYFAGYKNHIGFYPTGKGIIAFQDEITGYKTSKGTIQFPLNEPLPVKLIEKIVKFRIMENMQKTKKQK